MKRYAIKRRQIPVDGADETWFSCGHSVTDRSIEPFEGVTLSMTGKQRRCNEVNNQARRVTKWRNESRNDIHCIHATCVGALALCLFTCQLRLNLTPTETAGLPLSYVVRSANPLNTIMAIHPPSPPHTACRRKYKHEVQIHL